MSEQILYDRIINVTLYKASRAVEPSYISQVITGTAKTVLNSNKLQYTYEMNKYLNNPEIGGKLYNTSITLAFYPEGTKWVFAGYRKEQDGRELTVYEAITLSGKVHKVDTIEQMKNGRTTSGTIFGYGDKVKVKKDNSVWIVYPPQGSIEAANTMTEPVEALTIDCTKSGLKPDMALSINLLPGQNCYGATLKIRNLNLADTNIREWTKMVITAGYRTGDKAVYTCPIFTSYIEEPNPDGITVFEGITVGTAETVMNEQYTEIVFLQDKMKLKDLAEGVAQGIHPSIHVVTSISDDIMNEEIQLSKQTVYAQNGAAILSWLQSTLSTFIEKISIDQNNRTSAFVQLVGNELQIIALNGPNKMPEAIENIINLDMVTGATFSGTALTVIAPWNPALQPGNLFYMPPEFINGSKLPNVLPESDYRNEDNLYRALTINVAFASAENTNKMTILAVPAQWAGQLPSHKTTELRADVLAAALSRDINAVGSKQIQVGQESSVDTSEINNIYKDAPDTEQHMFDDFRNIGEIWGAWTNLHVDASMGDSCLSKALERYFLRDANGPHLTGNGAKGEGTQYNYYVTEESLKEQNLLKAVKHFQATGCSANYLWWPLVVVGTYWRKWIDDKNAAANNWSAIRIDDPDFIQNDRDLYIPMWTGSWSSMLPKLKMVKDIWKFAYQEYGEKYKHSAFVWRAMYYYLGGEGEL